MGASVRVEEAAAYLASQTSLRERLGVDGSAVLEPKRLGAGEHNVNFVFTTPEGSSWVLRVNVLPQPFHDNQVLYEYNALVAVEPSGCTPKPLFVDYSPTSLGEGVLVESFCPGDPLNYDALQPGDLERAAAIMAAIHKVDPSGVQTLHEVADPMKELFGECQQRFDFYRASAYADEGITQWVEIFLKRTQEAMDAVGPKLEERRIVNTEPLPSHFLLPRNASSPCAGYFVDWERPLLGDVLQDVAFFISPAVSFWDSDHFFAPEEEAQFLYAYQQQVAGVVNLEDFEARLLPWRRLTALRAVTWCCKNLIRYKEQTGHIVAKTQQKLPVYLSQDFLSSLAESCF